MKRINHIYGGHLFDFNSELWSSSEPLSCHDDDCVMNVFTLLKMISREKALNIASKSRGISDKTILSFLDHTFHTKHTKEEIYNATEDNLNDGIDHLLSFLPDGYAIIAGLISKKVSHLTIISNEGGSLYLYDPQIHEKIRMYSFEMFEYLEEFSSMHVYISYHESIQTTLNSSQLKINAIWNKHKLPYKKVNHTQSAPTKTKTKTKTRRRSFSF